MHTARPHPDMMRQFCVASSCLTSNTQHPIWDDRLEAKSKDSQNCSSPRCIVHDSCAQWYAHKCEQFLFLCCSVLLLFGVFISPILIALCFLCQRSSLHFVLLVLCVIFTARAMLCAVYAMVVCLSVCVSVWLCVCLSVCLSIVLISRKRYKIETYFQWKTNRKSYVAYRMAPVFVTLNDLEGHFPRSFPVCRPFKCNPSHICAAFYQISTDSVTWPTVP